MASSQLLLDMEVGAESQDRLDENNRVRSTSQGFVVPSRRDPGPSTWPLVSQFSVGKGIAGARKEN